MAQDKPPQEQRQEAGNSVLETAHGVGDSAPRLHALEPAPPDLTSPQLTLRALVTGMALGSLLSVCTVYVGLKIGQGFGVSLTAALLAYGIWAGFGRIAGRGARAWGILENNISQTASSAAASVASAGLVAPIPALALLTGQTLAWHQLAVWLLSVMLVGIVVAVPLRRQMIVVEKLPFPAGIASAEILREIHARGTEALARLKALAVGGAVAAAIKVLAALKILGALAPAIALKGLPAKALTLTVNPTVFPIGIGGLIGFRACYSLLIGAILAYGVLSTMLVETRAVRLPERVAVRLDALPSATGLTDEEGDVRYHLDERTLDGPLFMTKARRDELLALSADEEYRSAVRDLYQRSYAVVGHLGRWLVWPGVALMVVASLASLCFSWRSILAVPREWFRDAANGKLTNDRHVPWRWFGFGLVVVLAFSVTLQVSLFKITPLVAGFGVLLSFALAFVAARVTGETGIGVVGPLGKVTQLVFGFVTPKTPVSNLMAANVTGGAASQCADLLDDLKCGHLLGASPRAQTFAQLCGAAAGAMVGSAAYLILIPNPAEMLGTEEWRAPAALIWKSVAELFVRGFEALPAGVPTAMAVAAVAAVVLTTLERVGPQNWRPFVLSPVSLGLAFVLPASISFSIFLGGLLALVLRRWAPNWSARFLVATCVGLIAGESLTGIGLAFQRVLGG